MQRRTPTRSTHIFTPHEGTFAALYSRIVEQHVRCWLDMGPRKHAIQTIAHRSDADGPSIVFTIRVGDDKQGRLTNRPDDQVTWYEEAL